MQPVDEERNITPAIKGRGTASTLPGRFATRITLLDRTDDDGEETPSPVTELRRETAKTLITRNDSPDVPFNLSVNPYRGCEHGCIYCFARPTHAYLDLSPGLDFETRLSVKHNAPELFERELRHPRYRCEPIALGINTDAYQPVEKEQGVVRRLLQIALDYRQPLTLITKGGLILRDLDLLAAMAERNLVHVGVSVTTLDNDLKRILEPRTASPAMRLKVIRQLSAAGVPVSAMVAPVIPFINDAELESIVEACAGAGVERMAYVVLRLPHEVAPLFVEWLRNHFPMRADHVLNTLRDLRGGKLYDAAFGQRMRGRGIYADLIRQRFRVAIRKHGLQRRSTSGLDCSQFSPPVRCGEQWSLGF